MALPDELLSDVVWTFRGSHPERAAFVDAVRDYHVRIVKSADRWKPDEVVLNAPQIKVRYEHWEGDDEKERIVTFTADDGKAFTNGELLWKLNEDAAPRLAGQDHVFFEGLTLDEESESPDTYDMFLGS